ncbi:MAG: response regulator [Myxococcota bacterium]
MAKILCVDDDRDVIEFCKATLETMGYEILTARSGKEGFSKAVEEKPDLIMLDVMMDDTTDGLQTAYKLRGEESIKFTPILMLTSINQKLGYNFKRESDGAYLPVDDFVEKPISSKELLEKSKKLLGLKKEEINVNGISE